MIDSCLVQLVELFTEQCLQVGVHW